MTRRTRAQRRRERLKPDNRPRWNDPDLRVGRYQVSAEEQQYICGIAVLTSSYNWRDDPSYFWGEKKPGD